MVTMAEATARADFEQQMGEVSALLQSSNQSLSKALGAAEAIVTHAMRLQEMTAALSHALTEEEVADLVLQKGIGVVDAIRGLLARVDGRRFQIIRTSGYQPQMDEQMRTVTLDDDGPLTLAVRSGQPIWIETPEEHLARFPLLYQKLGVAPPQASVAVPLRHGGEIVGVLGMFFADSSAFGAAKQTFMLLLAQAVADALVRARSYDSERAARQQAETLAQARADVLGIVAHDLRNPLSAITSSSEFLLECDDLPTAQRRKMLEMMQRASKRMNRLINDLLDATQLQAGRISLDLSDIDACKVVREAEETLRSAAVDRGIHLLSEPPQRECYVRADEGRVLQVIGNLVGNALKFTEAGGKVRLSACPRDVEVIFSVADTGPGIPPEHQSQLFDTFWQARKGDRRGVGLGLSITRDIVTALGGRLWVESTVGVGSTFSFALPTPMPTVSTPSAIRSGGSLSS
jgi:signal transduction histidine kinase